MLKAGKSRIYVVKDLASGDERLVDAGNKSQSIRHCVRGKFAARLAEQRDLVRLSKSVEVEQYKSDDGE